MIVYIIIGVAIVIAAVVIALIVRPNNDPVDSFRRQIDALSPEARRPTVDQVRDAAEDSGETELDES